ncbi:MAG: DUF3299 domain-containing protein [Planctomycetes bacterium]|nr:DUF3299 domain-containing protein [Planctomycetota bacterium]MCB9917654.1 DUF3299 domain-containing protein [Planctomycetota bacterium]
MLRFLPLAVALCFGTHSVAQAPGGPVKEAPKQESPAPKPDAAKKPEPAEKQGSQPKADPKQEGKPAGEKATGEKTEKQDAEKQDAEKQDAEKQDAEKQGSKKEIKTKDADDSEIQLPEGATEDDIRAIRGANAMRETEKKLDEVLKKMHIPGDVPFIRFDKLDSWPYEDGYKGMPKDLAKLDGKKVVMAGFMLPIDEVEDIKTFYLVKSLWSCCYGIPPDVNGLVKIHVAAKKGIAYQWDPILVVGTFRLKKVMDEDYTICIWQMDDAQVRVIEVD